MKSSVQTRPVDAPPGLVGTARVDRRTRDLLPRLRPGDIAVVDHLDLDRATAQALVDAGVVAVVDASAFISGRYPNLGPQTLADAGVAARRRRRRRRAGARSATARPSGSTTASCSSATPRSPAAGSWTRDVGRRRDGARPAPGWPPSCGAHPQQHRVPPPRAGPAAARRRRARGWPPGSPAARSWWSSADGTTCDGELRRRPPVPARAAPGARSRVDAAADALRAGRRAPDVVVVDADDELPSAAALRAARDVVVHVDRGEHARRPRRSSSGSGVRPVAARDRGRARGHRAAARRRRRPDGDRRGRHARHASTSFLDRQRPGLAATFLTRLKVGPRLVDATAVPHLYSGRVRPWHLMLVLLAGLLALAAAISVTPVGQEWADSARAPRCSDLSTKPGTLLVISYRHHIVSLVAVFLALAAGVVLGGGPLSDLGRDDRAAVGDAPRRSRDGAAHRRLRRPVRGRGRRDAVRRPPRRPPGRGRDDARRRRRRRRRR